MTFYLLTAGVLLLVVAIFYGAAVLASKIDPVFIYYNLIALGLALVLASLVESRLQGILEKISKHPPEGMPKIRCGCTVERTSSFR